MSEGLLVAGISFDDVAKFILPALGPSQGFDLEISVGEFMVLVSDRTLG